MTDLEISQTAVNEARTSAPSDTNVTQRRSLDVLARSLSRAIPTMPKAARQFAYNLIEQIEGDVLFAPRMGAHKLQDPRRLLEWQMEQLEQAMKQAA